jgi:hypothetical protein
VGVQGSGPPSQDQDHLCESRKSDEFVGGSMGGEGTTAVVCAIPAPSVAIYTVVTQSVVDILDLSSVVAMIEKGLPL